MSSRSLRFRGGSSKYLKIWVFVTRANWRISRDGRATLTARTRHHVRGAALAMGYASRDVGSSLSQSEIVMCDRTVTVVPLAGNLRCGVTANPCHRVHD